MTLTSDKVHEAQEIISKGKENCFSDTDWNWALDVLKEAFNNGYGVIKVC